MDWTWYLFRFDGRISRAKFWLGVLVLFGLLMTWVGDRAIHSLFGWRHLPFGASDLFKLVDPDAWRSLTWADLPGSCSTVRHVAADVDLFRAAIKRLHDRDKSGWWMVPFFVVPGLCNQFADRLPIPTADLRWHCRVRSGCGASSKCTACNGSRMTNRFGPIRWRRRRRATRGHPWDQQSEIEMVPTRLARRRFDMLSRGHD